MSVLGPASHIITHCVQAPGGGLHVIDQPGAGPPVVLLHGFPDDSRIYQRLMPHMAPHRAVGAADEYLSPGLARHLAGMFGHTEVHVIDGASHWPQADQPETVARILKDVR